MRTGTGSPTGFGLPGDFGTLAQQYWDAWTDAMRKGGTAQPHTASDGWRQTLDGWSQLLGGGVQGTASDAVDRFNTQARHWLGLMQQVAKEFAGRTAGAGEIANAWRQTLGATNGNPFAGLFTEMAGRGQSGFQQWFDQVAPMLQGFAGGWRQGDASWTQWPAFGPAREHQERWQALAAAQSELQEKNAAYNALLLRAGQDAYKRFEDKLAERSEPGRQLQSARALFDVWIDAAEEAYAEIALSQEFRHLYGELVNAQMRVRGGIQREVEHLGALFGMPTRREMDAVHRKIVDIERQLRRARDATASSAAPEAQSAPASKRTRTSVKTQAKSKAKRQAPSKALSKVSSKALSKVSSKALSKVSSKALSKVSSKARTKAPSRPVRAGVAAATKHAPRKAGVAKKRMAIAMPAPLQPTATLLKRKPAVKQSATAKPAAKQRTAKPVKRTR